MRIRRPRGQRKDTCKCSNKARLNQRTCYDCHAAPMRKYRLNKKEKLCQ